MNSVKSLLRPLYAPFVRSYRNHAKMKKQQQDIRASVHDCAASSRPINIIIGAGETRYDGWLATDIPAFHVLKHEHWALLFQPGSINRMLAEHVFEHLTIDELGQFLRLARIYLSAGGRIRLAVPDGNHPDANYIKHVRPGGIGEGADDHKVLYTSDKIVKVFQKSDYDFQLLEFFDASGVFHREQWHAEAGFVGRSASNDERNVDGKLVYTSLIVDCWPRQYMD